MMAMIGGGIMEVFLEFALVFSFFGSFYPSFSLRFSYGLGMIWRKEMGGVSLMG